MPDAGGQTARVAAACADSVPGGVVQVVRYNEQKDALDYLFSRGEVVDDPGDSGRATQCTIHDSFAPSMADGVLVHGHAPLGATHRSTGLLAVAVVA